MVITFVLVAPMLPQGWIEGAVLLSLVVMAIGSGAIMLSHLNDSYFYFWEETQFSGLKVTDTCKGQTMATLVQGVVAMLLWVILFSG